MLVATLRQTPMKPELVPMMMGTLPPMGPMAYSCTRVTMPATSMAFCMQCHLDGCEVLCVFAHGTGTGDDEDRGQVAHKHGQHVLQAQGDCLSQRDTALKIVGRSRLFCFFHTLTLS